MHDGWFTINKQEQFQDLITLAGLKIHELKLPSGTRDSIVLQIASRFALPTTMIPIKENVSKYGVKGHAFLWDSLPNSSVSIFILPDTEFMCFTDCWYIDPYVISGLTNAALESLSYDIYFLDFRMWKLLFWNDHGGYGPGQVEFEPELMRQG